LATVHFSRSLREHTGGAESVTLDAPRVQELLNMLTERFPGLAAPLEVMAVSVDGEIRQEPEFVPLSGDSEVHLVPKIPGG
jgi:molybdopterin converting factor small subunit